MISFVILISDRLVILLMYSSLNETKNRSFIGLRSRATTLNKILLPLCVLLLFITLAPNIITRVFATDPDFTVSNVTFDPTTDRM